MINSAFERAGQVISVETIESYIGVLPRDFRVGSDCHSDKQIAAPSDGSGQIVRTQVYPCITTEASHAVLISVHAIGHAKKQFAYTNILTVGEVLPSIDSMTICGKMPEDAMCLSFMRGMINRPQNGSSIGDKFAFVDGFYFGQNLRDVHAPVETVLKRIQQALASQTPFSRADAEGVRTELVMPTFTTNGRAPTQSSAPEIPTAS